MLKFNKKGPLVWLPSKKMLATQEISRQRLMGSSKELNDALEILDQYPKRVTMFGSARNSPAGEPYRQAAHEIAFQLAKLGYAIVTGGSGGIMEACNMGAHDAGGISIGFNIELPKEQQPNAYTTHSLPFHYFFNRKVTMTFFSHAYIYFPGGFGTFDEMTEVLTLIQTQKMPPLKVILFGSEYWQSFDTFVKEHLLTQGYISPGDEKIYTITDDVEEAVRLANLPEPN